MDLRLLKELLLNYIREDVCFEDITSKFTPNRNVTAKLIANSPGIVSGVDEVKVLFSLFNIHVVNSVKDGGVVPNSGKIMTIKGNARNILLVERTALNILSRMSGITTLTKKFIEKAKKANPKVKIAATRKTTPGFRYFEKKAVEVAGGDTHRMNLSDMIMIKDNHLNVMGGNVKKAVQEAKKHTTFAHKIEVEVSNKKDALLALKAGADIIMLDNMKPKEIKEMINALKKTGLRGKAIIEASGGVNLENIQEYASTGVDVISIGSLTTSYQSFDISLELK